MNKGNNKSTCCCCDPDTIRREAIKNEIEINGDRSTWLLGFLIVIILALVGLVFASYGMPPPENEMNDSFRIGRSMALILLSSYLVITPTYIWKLIVPDLKKLIYEAHETEEMYNDLKKLAYHFRTLVSLSIIAVPLSFISAFGYWYLFIK